MKSFCVIGLGKFGMSLAQTLAEDGKQVMVIDIDGDKVTALADVVTNAVIGDPTNEKVLRSAGVADYECAIVCMTGNINDNILLSMMLKEIGVKKVVSRAINKGHKKVLSSIGVDMIVFPEQDMGVRLGHMLGRDNVTEYMEFSGFKLVEAIVPPDWFGKNLIGLELRRKYDVTVVAVTSEDGSVDVSPSPTRVFCKGDRATIIGDEHDIERIVKQMK